MSFHSIVPGRVWCVAAGIAFAIGCARDVSYGGRHSSDWINRLQSSSVQERVEAAAALGRMLRIRPDLPKIVNALGFAVGDTSDMVRLEAANALAARGVDRLAALPGLQSALHDSRHASVRASTAYIIGGLGSMSGRPFLRSLVETMNDSVAMVRAAAVESLGMLESVPRAEMVEIVNHAADPDPGVRRAVFQTLLNLKAPADLTVPPAERALFDSSVTVRVAASHLMAELGPAARPAIAALTKALSDSSLAVATSAAFALGSIGMPAKSAAPALRRLATSDSPEAARAARRALALVSVRAQ